MFSERVKNQNQLLGNLELLTMITTNYRTANKGLHRPETDFIHPCLKNILIAAKLHQNSTIETILHQGLKVLPEITQLATQDQRLTKGKNT